MNDWLTNPTNPLYAVSPLNPANPNGIYQTASQTSGGGSCDPTCQTVLGIACGLVALGCVALVAYVWWDSRR